MEYFKLIMILFVLMFATSCKSRREQTELQIKTTTEASIGSTAEEGKNDSISESNSNDYQSTQEVFSDIEIIRELPHDTHAYTQGLIYHNGILYESTGQYGKSSLRKLDPNSGEILAKETISNQYFAEGITIFSNKIYQLTWRAGTGFVYDGQTLKQKSSFAYYGEGWGITNDNKYLIMSDGTNALRFLDPKTLEIVKTVFVIDENSVPLQYLNELEYINNEIWANVYTRNYIVRINPEEGRVVSRIDLSFLIDKIEITPETDVLNGIAYDKQKDEYYFTGKNWNKIFVVKMK